MAEASDSARSVLLKVENGVATLIFNRPDSLNALTPQMLEEGLAILEQIEAGTGAAEGGVRALILTGVGRAFCAGADLAASGKTFLGPREERDLGALLESHYHPFLQALRRSRAPIVAAVNGLAAGAGMSVALSADLIVAAEDAYFLQAFRGIGLVPDAGSTYLLPRRIGRARALELSLLGERLPARQALEWGLINRVTPPEAVLEEASALARRLADGPPVAQALMRDLYDRSEQSNYDGQLAAEAEAQRAAGRTEDAEEGVRAFLEKRAPVFKGR